MQVEASLLHDHIEAREVFISEVEARLGHVSIEDLVEKLDVGAGVANDALNEAMIAV